MASAAFIEALPVIEFVAQLLGKVAIARSLPDSDRVKVRSINLANISLKYFMLNDYSGFVIRMCSR